MERDTRNYNSKEWKELGGGIALMIDLIFILGFVIWLLVLPQINKLTEPERKKPVCVEKVAGKCIPRPPKDFTLK